MEVMILLTVDCGDRKSLAQDRSSTNVPSPHPFSLFSALAHPLRLKGKLHLRSWPGVMKNQALLHAVSTLI